MNCLVPACKRKAAAGCKGQCMVCWSTTKKLIAKKKTTLEELQTLGLIEGQQSPVEQALAKARKGTNASSSEETGTADYNPDQDR